MANWPIVRSQRTMPGTSTGVRANLDFDTGEGEIWRQIGNLAAAGVDVATKLYLKQAEDQYSAAQIQSMKDEAGYAKSLGDELDETKYDAMLDSHISSQDKLRPKNPLAAKAWDGYIAKRSINLKKTNEAAKHDRLADKWVTSLNEEALTAEQTNNMTLVREKIFAGIALGYVKESAGMKFLRDTEERIVYNMGLNYALTNPEKLLKNIKVKNGKTYLEGYPTLTSGQIIALESNALGAISDKKIAQDRLTLEATSRLKKYATDPKVNVGSMQAKISQSDALTPGQKIKAMELFNRSRNTMAAGGGNPFTTTENWSLYDEDRRRAVHKDITEQEIVDHVGPGMYSWPQAEHLLSIVNGKSSSAKAFEDTAAAKGLKAIIDYELDPKTDIEINRYAVNKYLGILEDKLENNSDWTKSEKVMEALRIGRQFKRDYEDKTLEKSLENAIKGPLYSKLKPSGFIKPGIPHPKIKAEYDVLHKVGDTINKGGKKWKVVDFDTDGTPLVEEI